MPTNQEIIYNSVKVALKIHGLQLDTLDIRYAKKRDMNNPKALAYIDPETMDCVFNEDEVEKVKDIRILIIEAFHIVRHYVQRTYVMFNRYAVDIPQFEKALVPRWRADFRMQDDPERPKRKPEFYLKQDSEIDATAFGYIIALHEFGFEDELPELTKEQILARALELEYEFGYKERPIVEEIVEEKVEINPNDDLYVIETDENGMLVYKLRRRSDDEILEYGTDGSDEMTDEEKKAYEKSIESTNENAPSAIRGTALDEDLNQEVEENEE